MRLVMKKQARITSKGQITIPLEVRRALGVGPGDQLLFEKGEEGMSVRPVRTESPFAKYRGIGHGGRTTGKQGILRRIRELRGE
jgi:AbrB family looped-hinge helix DNA binding protein